MLPLRGSEEVANLSLLGLELYFQYFENVLFLLLILLVLLF
jgi:hypothetical protein